MFRKITSIIYKSEIYDCRSFNWVILSILVSDYYAFYREQYYKLLPILIHAVFMLRRLVYEKYFYLKLSILEIPRKTILEGTTSIKVHEKNRSCSNYIFCIAFFEKPYQFVRAYYLQQAFSSLVFFIKAINAKAITIKNSC